MKCRHLIIYCITVQLGTYVNANIKANDTACTPGFVDQYFSTKECLLSANEEQCLSLAINSKITGGAIGGSIGLFASKIFQSYLDKNVQFKKKFEEFINEAHYIYRLKEELRGSYRDKLNQLIGDRTNGKFNNYDQYISAVQKAKNTGNTEFLKFFNDSDLESLKKEASQKVSSNLPKTSGLTHPTIKDMSHIYFSQDPPYASDVRINNFYKNQVQNLLRRIFHEQFKIGLKDLPEGRGVYFTSTARADVRLVGNYFNNIQTSEWPAVDGNKRIALREIEKSSAVLSKYATPARMAAKGVISGVVAGELFDGIKLQYYKYALSKCGDKLDLTKGEINTLTDYSLFRNQKILYLSDNYSNFDCSKIKLNFTREQFDEIQKTWNGYPEGICKLMHKELDENESYFSKNQIDQISCEPPKYVVRGDSLNLNFQYGIHEVRYDGVTNWPDTPIQSIKSGQSSLSIGIPCSTSIHFKDHDNLACSQKQILSCSDASNSSESCNFIRAATLTRLQRVLSQSLCPDNIERSKIKPISGSTHGT